MSSNEHWAVIGAGFRGLVGSYLLAKRGHRVTLIDRGKKPGGVLYSESYKGFFVDKGCHMFDNTNDTVTDLMLEIMDGEVKPVDVKYASFINGQKTDNMALPDFSTFGEQFTQQVLAEIDQAVATPPKSAQHLQEHMELRFGVTASREIARCVKKTHLIDLEELDPLAANGLLFPRIKIADDARSAALKKDPKLDELIAISRPKDDMAFNKDLTSYPHRYFYPTEHGLRGFCEKAQQKLEGLGVDIRLETAIQHIEVHDQGVEISIEESADSVVADRVLWAGANELASAMFGVDSDLETSVWSVPMVLFYFFVDQTHVSDYSYIHNFNQDNLIFRASIPTNYGSGNAPPGKAYLCCEVPTPIGSEVWEDPQSFIEQVWQELLTMELVQGTYDEVLPFKVPATYKIPKIGYREALDKLVATLPAGRVVGLEGYQFAKSDLTKELLRSLEGQNL